VWYPAEVKELRSPYSDHECSVCVQYMRELRASFGDAVDMWDHYDVLNKSHVDISNFGEYFITTVEMLLISQRKVHVRVRSPLSLSLSLPLCVCVCVGACACDMILRV